MLLSIGPAQLVTLIVVGLLINFFISRFISKLANHKEVSNTAVFWISFLLTPILGILVVIASKEKKEID